MDRHSRVLVNGVFSDVNAKGEPLELAWKLDVDLPVRETPGC